MKTGRRIAQSARRRALATAARTTFLILIACRTVGAQSLPAPWTNADVGAPVLSGSASHSAGVFTIDGAGVDIWGTADQFHFVYQQVDGDVEIVARVESVTAAHKP